MPKAPAQVSVAIQAPSTQGACTGMRTGKAADIKRCAGMRSALDLLDFQDASIGDLKRLLLRAAFSPAFLRAAEGRRFLAHLFTLDVREPCLFWPSNSPHKPTESFRTAHCGHHVCTNVRTLAGGVHDGTQRWALKSALPEGHQ